MEVAAGYDCEEVQLQESLADWRHIIVEADAWLRWERDSYPYTLCAAVTLIYLFIWLMQPPILTTVSLLVMVACLLDYLVPSVFKDYFNKQTWTQFKQERYEKCCSQLVFIKKSLVALMNLVVDLRENKPKYYFLLASVILLTIAFIGSAIPGLILAYLLSLFLVLLPGMVYHGILASLYARLLQVFVDMIKRHKKQD